MTDREQFCAVLFTQPLLRADCLVVLGGEDGEARGLTAVELMRQNAAPCVLITGGLDDERRAGALTLGPVLLGAGVSPGRLLMDTEAMNTWDQAVNTIRTAQANDWHRLLVLASPYHAPRAFLTFVKALQREQATDSIGLTVVPVAHVAWWDHPAGMDQTRLDLLAGEMEKCTEYTAHVATWDDGLAYLKAWEGR